MSVLFVLCFVFCVIPFYLIPNRLMLRQVFCCNLRGAFVCLPPLSSSSTFLLAPDVQVLCRRGKKWAPVPGRGTPHRDRFFFDWRHLNEITGGEYTHNPLRINRLGGRDPETGKGANKRIGGGVKFDYFMLDLHRRGPKEEGETYDERVIEVRRDPNRTPHIALVAGVQGKRWIYATENMQAGQIIQTSGYIPLRPIIGVEGNAYPIGALAVGSIVNCVELIPHDPKGHVVITEAGGRGEVVRRLGAEHIVVRMPNKHEYSLHQECMATVGKLSHTDWNTKIWGSPQMHRRFGVRPTSGPMNQIKPGYCGRKIRKLPPVREIELNRPKAPPKQRFTITKQQLSHNFGAAAVHPLVAEFKNCLRI